MESQSQQPQPWSPLIRQVNIIPNSDVAIEEVAYTAVQLTRSLRLPVTFTHQGHRYQASIAYKEVENGA